MAHTLTTSFLAGQGSIKPWLVTSLIRVVCPPFHFSLVLFVCQVVGPLTHTARLLRELGVRAEADCQSSSLQSRRIRQGRIPLHSASRIFCLLLLAHHALASIACYISSLACRPGRPRIINPKSLVCRHPHGLSLDVKRRLFPQAS